MAPEYVLTRDYVDNNRINLQHYLWCEIFGYRIHPRFSVEDTDLRIADVGTGTSVWLTDLAARMPATVKLEGLDVSFEATAPKPMLPSNIVLQQWNVKDAVPTTLMGRYDMLHIRHFMFVLLDDEVPGVLARLVQMLKPGGFLQWSEHDLTGLKIARISTDTKTEAHQELLRATLSQDRRLTPRWVPRLPNLFSASGLVAVEHEIREAAPHLAMAMHECNMSLHELIARQTGNNEFLVQVQGLLPEAAREIRNGAYFAWPMWTVVGRKAVDGYPRT
ncbi:S-adenosyl-L-methionine-dependent methyltransferase [Xylaria sp. FL0064]|nr:S-adenosyl-L-methionine-dependent methyltransferase [Xylaria sp. FL0064]